ncbi:jg1427 [Pararge aegeria aegeria]|uniref:Jg1427 protein n=1 Tax=Pararge aegeria aegeria TaxID=348720 RepID=A0A8S4RM10_9NEOP|nr:jg1427 [Pararge aegeria aegeria]
MEVRRAAQLDGTPHCWCTNQVISVEIEISLHFRAAVICIQKSASLADNGVASVLARELAGDSGRYLIEDEEREETPAPAAAPLRRALLLAGRQRWQFHVKHKLLTNDNVMKVPPAT